MTGPKRLGARLGRVVTTVAVLLVAPNLPTASALPPTTVDSGMWQVDGRVQKILQTDSAIYLAGTFKNLLGPKGEVVPRANLAALDPGTGAPLPFNPSPNGQVFALALSPDGSSLYLGGDFFKVGGVNRKRASKVDAVTGVVSTWAPTANSRVEALATRGDLVYLGGDFTLLGDTPRARLAAVSASTGVPDVKWIATADAIVHDIAVSVDGARILAGGAFNSVSGSTGFTQRRIASLDPITGKLQTWASHPSYEIFDIEATRTQVFAAAGGSGGHTMAYDLGTGTQQWVGFSDGDCVGVEYQNGTLFVGGHFTMWQGVAASHAVALNPTTGARVTWTIKVNSNLGIYAIDSHDGHLAIGGDFTKINNLARAHFAQFSETVDTQPPSTPGQPSGTSAAPTTIDLTWAASTDIPVTSIIYRVYRDGLPAPVGAVTSSSTTTVTFHDGGLFPGSTHSYQVIADDGQNLSDASPVSHPITTLDSVNPVLTSLTMLDTDTNGRVDQIVATFSNDVSCTGLCLGPWTLTALPSGTTLKSVALAGDTATLTLAEGSPLKTDVGSATVALAASPAGVVDAEGDAASFAATSPTDAMAPVAVSMTSTNVGLTPGVMEVGDTLSVTFSEALNPASVIAANVKQADPLGAGNDFMIVVGLTNSGMALGSDAFVVPDGGTIVYQDSTLTMADSNKTVRSTIVGACTGTACGLNGPGATGDMTMSPEPFLRDVAGNHADGTLTQNLTLY